MAAQLSQDFPSHFGSHIIHAGQNLHVHLLTVPPAQYAQRFELLTEPVQGKVTRLDGNDDIRSRPERVKG